FWYGFIITSTLVLLYRKARFAIVFTGVFCLLSGSYAIKKTKQYFNKSLVVYHSSRETIIDLFDGRQTYTLHHASLDQKTLDAATQQHRWAMGSKHTHVHFLNQKTSTTYHNCWIRLPYIQFHDQRIMLLDHAQLLPSDTKLQVDYLLIHDDPDISIEKILKVITPQRIIFDTSNRFSRVKKWKAECERLGITYYSIHDKGAFVEEF
ncbi:MAG: hypothetical protein AAF599_04230, partial [Bacteroidota bacterium]